MGFITFEHRDERRVFHAVVALERAVQPVPRGQTVLGRLDEAIDALAEPKVASAWEALTRPRHLRTLERWAAKDLGPVARTIGDRAIARSRERYLRLVEIARRLLGCDGTEAELAALLAELQREVPHPRVSELIYHPRDATPTAQAIVDEALAWEELSPRPPPG